MFSLYRLSVRLLQWSYSVNLLKLFSRVFQQTLVSHSQSREVTCCCQEIKLEQWEQSAKLAGFPLSLAALQEVRFLTSREEVLLAFQDFPIYSSVCRRVLRAVTPHSRRLRVHQHLFFPVAQRHFYRPVRRLDTQR